MTNDEIIELAKSLSKEQFDLLFSELKKRVEEENKIQDAGA